MPEAPIREFRLARGWPDGLNPFLSEDGAFLGDGTPLLERVGHQWRPRTERDLDSVLAKAFGSSTRIGWRMESLATIARALNRGDRSLAAIALVQAELPTRLAKDGTAAKTEARVLPGNGKQSGEWTASPAASMSISDSGKKFIRQYEGKKDRKGEFESQEYPGEDKKNRTIGFGRKLSSQSFFPDGISESDAETMFMDDIADAQHAVQTSVKVLLTQPQYDALVSLTFNIGSGRFRNSALLQALNAGDYGDAADRFGDWTYSEGKYVQGLKNRRDDEQALFRSGTK
ncbi:MAG TPA: lysozyme [Magnetospirillaceae bacterium]|jgi:GH24 family phage-related lysozyme (muramidase)